jgi:hypothetical protein
MGAEQRGRRPRKDSRKRFSPQGRKGDQGIAFIHGVVSAMGFVWVENKGYADAGIDGFIELADPNTGEAFNRRLLVQSKAGPSYFKNERGDTFEFHCDQRDLDYWLSGDAPVILVVSRHGIEGYWVSIKDYFATTERASARKILFDKATDSFDSTARSKLFDLGSAGSGIFLQPIPKYETLFSNLVPLELGFEKVYLGTTHIESEAEFDRQMSPGHDAPLWAVHEGLVTSVCDLRNSSFQEVVDHGSIEEWSVREASESPELESRMIHLLGRIVRTFLATFKVRYHNVREFYYFQANHRQGGPAPGCFGIEAISRTLTVRSWPTYPRLIAPTLRVGDTPPQKSHSDSSQELGMLSLTQPTSLQTMAFTSTRRARNSSREKSRWSITSLFGARPACGAIYSNTISLRC